MKKLYIFFGIAYPDPGVGTLWPSGSKKSDPDPYRARNIVSSLKRIKIKIKILAFFCLRSHSSRIQQIFENQIQDPNPEQN